MTKRYIDCQHILIRSGICHIRVITGFKTHDEALKALAGYSITNTRSGIINRRSLNVVLDLNAERLQAQEVF